MCRSLLLQTALPMELTCQQTKSLYCTKKLHLKEWFSGQGEQEGGEIQGVRLSMEPNGYQTV